MGGAEYQLLGDMPAPTIARSAVDQRGGRQSLEPYEDYQFEHLSITEMDIRVSYEHSLASSSPDDFIVLVPSQMICDVPATIPRALLPEYVANLLRERSPSIGRIRNLRVLS
jgi:hypothetical protein